jgi:serine/threonine protein phosphatase PrpC
MKEQTTTVTLKAAVVSDRGLSKKRPLNEDSFLSDPQRRIFAVADGVGGAQAGEVASQTAMEVLDEAFRHHEEGTDIEDLMEIAIQRANSSIHRMSREHPKLSMMATTVVVLHLDGHVATIGHVGDSRLYRLAPDGQLHRETADHSVVEEEVRAGRMTPDQAANHPSRNVISRALGAEEGVEVDLKTIEIEDGTAFLLCSDGITRHIPDNEIRELLATGEDLEAVCEEMKRRCYERGAEDNLTAVIVRVGGYKPVPVGSSDIHRTEPGIRPQLANTMQGNAAPSGPVPSQLAATASGPAAMPPPSIAPPAPPPPMAASPGAPESSSGELVLSRTPRRSIAGTIAKTLFFIILLAAVGAGGFFLAIYYPKLRPSFAATPPAANANTATAPITNPTSPPLDERRSKVDKNAKEWLEKDKKKAMEEQGLAEGQELQSQDPVFLYLYGRALMLANGYYDEALKAFDKAASLIKDNPAAESGLSPFELKITAAAAEAANRHKTMNMAGPTPKAKELHEAIQPAPAPASPGTGRTRFPGQSGRTNTVGSQQQLNVDQANSPE